MKPKQPRQQQYKTLHTCEICGKVFDDPKAHPVVVLCEECRSEAESRNEDIREIQGMMRRPR